MTSCLDSCPKGMPLARGDLDIYIVRFRERIFRFLFRSPQSAMGRKLPISPIPSELHHYVCYGFNSRPSVITDTHSSDRQLPANSGPLQKVVVKLRTENPRVGGAVPFMGSLGTINHTSLQTTVFFSSPISISH